MKVSQNSKYQTHEKPLDEKIFPKKVSQCRKKLKWGTIWDFTTSILSQNIKNSKRGPFGDNLFSDKNVPQAEKSQRWDPVVSPGIVC